jgi:phosphate transport system protein
MAFLQKDWNELRDQLLLMGGEVEQAIDRGMTSLTERDSTLAEAVLLDDDRIDEHELIMDDICHRLLARQTLSESEIRLVMTAAKITPILERIADHACNIARAALDLNDEPQLKPYIDLPRMSRVARTMLTAALDAYAASDARAARAVIEGDEELDRLYDRIFHELLDYMSTDQNAASRAARLLLVAKHLERIGDYVTDICEQIVYMTEAQVIKHPRLSTGLRAGLSEKMPLAA